METVIAAKEIIRRRICTLSGSYAELPGSLENSSRLPMVPAASISIAPVGGWVFHSRYFPTLAAITASAHVDIKERVSALCWLLKVAGDLADRPRVCRVTGSGVRRRLCDARRASPLRALESRSLRNSKAVEPSRNRHLCATVRSRVLVEWCTVDAIAPEFWDERLTGREIRTTRRDARAR